MPPRRQRGGRALQAENSEQVEKWKRVQRFMALRYEISKEILEKTNRKRIPSGEFLTEHNLGKIWTDDRLSQILELAEVVELGMSRQVIEDARDNFKKIFSILIEIGWNEWSRFREIFWDHGDGEGDRTRVDKDLPFVLEEMRRDDFLGDVYASKFMKQQFTFIPICIEAGKHNKALPGLRLPFVNENTELIGKGGFGEVTKEVIAYRQFSYQNESRSLNEVRFPPPPPPQQFYPSIPPSEYSLCSRRNSRLLASSSSTRKPLRRRSVTLPLFERHYQETTESYHS